MKDLHKDSKKSLNEIKTLIKKDKKLVFVSGNFNVVHPGHLRLLRFAADCGDYLVVGVYSDKIGHVVVPENLRLESMKSISWIDYTFILNDKPEDFIKHLKPDIVVKGKEHEDKYNPEQTIIDSYGGKLLFSSGDIIFSSIDLIKDEFKQFNYSNIVKPNDYLQRHNISNIDLSEIILKFNNLNLLVIGELIIDEYISCDPIGMSQEDPTIVVTPVLSKKFIGAAGIVAGHAKGLGANVSLFTVVGNDHIADFARKKLNEYGINSYLYQDESRPTICKQRYRANDKILLRVNHLHQHDINKKIQENIFNDIKEIIDNFQLVIFSDFNYGCLPQNLVVEIINLCKTKGIMMVADSQSSSQMGDVSRFNNMVLLTPTEREARLAVRDYNSGLVILAEKLREKANARNVFLTLGSEGLLIHAYPDNGKEWLTDKLSSMNKSPKDVSGAGDSLLITSSMSLAVGANIWQSAYLGSLAASCQISRIGNLPLSIEDIKKEI